MYWNLWLPCGDSGEVWDGSVLSTVKNYDLIRSPEEFTKFVDRILDGDGLFAFDIETGYDGPEKAKSSVRSEIGKIVGFSFSGDPAWARYVPLTHDLGPNLPADVVVPELHRLVTEGRMVAHNLKFELRFLRHLFRQHGLSTDIRGFSDTQIEAFLLAEFQSVGLKALTKAVFQHDQQEITTLFPDLTKQQQSALRFNSLELTPAVIAYACEDSAWCLALHQKFYPRVSEMFLYSVEMKVLHLLVEMEEYGLVYNWDAMRSSQQQAADFLDPLEAEIMADLTQAVGEPVSINLGSPMQIGNILYERLGITSQRKSKKTGKPSTDDKALAALEDSVPAVKKIRQWKEVRTLATRYLAKYEDDFKCPDGLAHPDHMQTVVGTGRFAVQNPAYQQTPKAMELTAGGHEFRCNFREFVISPPEHYILGFDLSQAELRVMAGEAGETSLIRAFENNEDIHTATAASMFRIPRDKVTKQDRSRGKTLNFALLYGQGPAALAETLKVTKDEAKQLIEDYFSAFPSVSSWIKTTTAESKKRGFTLSKFGRRFTVWELLSDDKWIQSKGERLCVNAPIQGGAADYMKVAMVRADAALRKAGLKDRVHLVMNIHDALEFYTHESLDPKDVIDVLRPAVEFEVAGWPPMLADFHYGPSWGNLTEVPVEREVREPEPQPIQAVPERVQLMTKVQVLDPEVIRGPAAELVVTMEEMPERDDFRRLVSLIKSVPGDQKVTLVTPEGSLVVSETSGLALEDIPRVGIALPGARVTAPKSTSVVLEGLDL